MPDKNSTIFIIGSPRSGKTLLQNIIGFHEELAWFSQFNSKFSNIPAMGIINRIYDIPLLGNFFLSHSQSRYLPHPEEISKKYVPIMRRYGSLDENDLKKSDKKKLQEVFQKQLFYQKKRKIIADSGRPARLLYFNHVFPNTKFIHVIRDGREVVAELIVKYPYMFNQDVDLKELYPNSPPQLVKIADKYKNTDEYEVVLAALYWKIALMEIEKQIQLLNRNNIKKITYEEIVQNPRQTMQSLLKYLGLNISRRIDNILSKKKLGINSKKQYTYSEKENQLLTKILNKELAKYGYI